MHTNKQIYLDCQTNHQKMIAEATKWGIGLHRSDAPPYR